MTVGEIKSRIGSMVNGSVKSIKRLGVDVNGNTVYQVSWVGEDFKSSSGNFTVGGGTISQGGKPRAGGGGVAPSEQGATLDTKPIDQATAPLRNIDLFGSASEVPENTVGAMVGANRSIFDAVDQSWQHLIDAGYTGAEAELFINEVLVGAWGKKIEAESDGRIQIHGITAAQVPAPGDPNSQVWVWSPTRHLANTGAAYDGQESFITVDGRPLEGAPLEIPVNFQGGGGGGGGADADDFIFFPPFHPDTYQRPDQGLISDLIEKDLKLLLGASHSPERLKMLTQMYMAAHYKQWLQQQAISEDKHLAGQDATIMEAVLKGVPFIGRDSLHQHLEAIQVEDPMQTVRELIRTFDDYKRLHALRPTDMDEEQWLPMAIDQQRQRGIGMQASVERGQVLAMTGDITANPTEFLGSTTMGTKMPEFFKKVEQAATILGSMAR